MSRIHTIDDPQVAREVLGSEVFRVDNPLRGTRRIFGPSVLDTEGRTHWRKKRSWSLSFNRSTVEAQFAPLVHEALKAALGIARQHDDLFLAADALPNLVVLSMIGCGEVDPLAHYARIRPIARFLEDGQAGPELDAAIAYIRSLQSDDAPCPFRMMAPEDRLPERLLLLLAGVETTVVAAKIVLLRWLRDRSGLQGLVARVGLTEAVIEVLRSDPPLGLATRFCGKAGGTPGCPVGRGDLVHVDLAAVAAQEAGAKDHLVFGAGKHRCPGSHLALLELSAFLGALLEEDEGAWHAEPQGPGAARPATFRHPAGVRIRAAVPA